MTRMQNRSPDQMQNRRTCYFNYLNASIARTGAGWNTRGERMRWGWGWLRRCRRFRCWLGRGPSVGTFDWQLPETTINFYYIIHKRRPTGSNVNVADVLGLVPTPWQVDWFNLFMTVHDLSTPFRVETDRRRWGRVLFPDRLI